MLALFKAPVTFTPTATCILPAGEYNFIVLGSATITTIPIHAANVGTIVRFRGGASALVVFTNDDAATAVGAMDLGGSNITLEEKDVLELELIADGSWIRIKHIDN